MLTRYLAFVLLAHVGPGLAACRLMGLALDPALVLAFGLAACAGAYWLAAATGASWLFPVLVLALNAALLAPRGPWRRAAGPSLRGALPPFAVLVALLAATQYGGNRHAPDGRFVLDPFLAEDTAFHVGLTRELVLGYPPQAPGLAGQPIGYHLGTDLVRAAALRWAAVDPFDSIARLDVTLFALALLLSLRSAAWSAGLRGGALALVGWAPLAADLSFLFAANPQAHWWTDLLRGNVLISLFLANPMIPGLALALGALAALGRALSREQGRWLAAAALLAGALPFFKVFLGAHLLMGLGGLAAFGGRERLRPAILVALPCVLATAALVFGQGGEPLHVGLAPLDLVRTTREQLGLEPVAGAALGVWTVLWLAASLGLRTMGLPAAVRAARSGPPVAQALAWMALGAWPIGLLFRVSPPATAPGQKSFNDIYVLIEQGGFLLWVFTAAALARWLAGRTRAALTLAVAALLCFPATVQFVWKKSRLPPDPVPADMVQAMRAVERHSRPGDVVLQRPGARYPALPVVLAGRRVVYERFTAYSTQFAPAQELLRRHERLYRFFRTQDPAEARAIAHETGAVLVALYGRDRVRFDAAGLLEPVYERPEARVFRIVGGPGGAHLTPPGPPPDAAPASPGGSPPRARSPVAPPGPAASPPRP